MPRDFQYWKFIQLKVKCCLNIGPCRWNDYYTDEWGKVRNFDDVRVKLIFNQFGLVGSKSTENSCIIIVRHLMLIEDAWMTFEPDKLN